MDTEKSKPNQTKIWVKATQKWIVIIDLTVLFKFLKFSAQSVEHATLDVRIASSSLTLGVGIT